jgi:hypothetical protein
MGDLRNAYRIVVYSKPECLDTQTWRGYNIKIDLKDIDFDKINWLKMSQGCVQLHAC